MRLLCVQEYFLLRLIRLPVIMLLEKQNFAHVEEVAGYCQREVTFRFL